MAPVTSNGTYHAQIESHEDRLQRVEATLQEVVAKVAETGVKLDFMSQRSDDQTTQILEKIESVTGTLKPVIDEASESSRFNKDALDSQSLRIRDLEGVGRASRVRMASLKKIAIGVALAGLGALASSLGHELWTWLSR